MENYSINSLPVESNLFVEYKRTKNIKIKNEIILKNQKLVTYIVNKFYNKNKEHKILREDLIQEGKIGLMNAVDGFKPELKFQFSTYATWWVKQSINNYLLNQMPLIKVSGNIKTAQNKLYKKLKEENLTLTDLIDGNVASTEMTEKMLNSIKASIKSKWISYLDDPVSSDPGVESTLKDFIPSNEPDPNSLLDHATLKDCLKESFKELPEREQMILMLRYNVVNNSAEGDK